jgi:hypothetical protein
MNIDQMLEQLSYCRPEAEVIFDFCGLRPTKVDSWRGSYDMPAVGWTREGTITVADFVSELKEAISGIKYPGYKGGLYTFDRTQELHVDNYGEYTETIITKVKNKRHFVVLKTKHREYF